MNCRFLVAKLALSAANVLLGMTTVALLGMATVLPAQQPSAKRFSRADTLRGSNGPDRAWWDAQFYDLHVRVNPADSSISGYNRITYTRLRVPGKPATGVMQIDLQPPLVIDSVVQERRSLRFRRDSNGYFVTVGDQGVGTAPRSVTVYYHGKPRVAKRAPWDGGFVWSQDSLGRRFIATANQGLGASVWWPNKDWGGDEPDSQRVAITVPDSMTNVSNGRLRSVTRESDGWTTWEWFVTNPINNYGIAVNAGQYAHFAHVYQGERGPLTMDFYPLAIHADTARVQFRQAIPTIACFEHWFGPYPFYEDGFKLVETPHLGMEHQSAVAYGNKYKNGYLGTDRSRTGRGLKWDFIIVHETAHEWWANNITAKDLADMWVHESFGNYSEGLYTECQEGKAAGAEYIIGSRQGIRNDAPIIPAFGVNDEGSGDMYPKGGAMLHTIRQIIDDDEKWRRILRGANATFRHQTIDGQQLRDYISREAGIDLSKVFEQYLTTTKIPVLEYRAGGDNVYYRWANVVPGFDMPVDIAFPDAPTRFRRIKPTTSWSAMQSAINTTDTLVVRPDFYVELRRVAN
jgi:aminopeptidase N